MTELFHQLGQLFIQAIPTVIIVFLFYLFMSWAFFKPVMKAMKDRKAHIEGARVEAAAAQEAARQELDRYHEAIRKVRGEIFAEQEAQRQAILDERARLLKAMRARAQEDVDAAKKRIAADLAAARAEIERQTPELANEIARAILAGGAPLPGGARR